MPLRAQGEEEPIGKGRGLGEDLTNKPGTPHKHLGSCCPLYFWPNLKIVMKPLLSLRETASTWPSWKLSYLTVEHETPARQIYGFCQHFPVPCLLFPSCCHDLLTSVSLSGGSPSARAKPQGLRLEAGPLLERSAAPSLRKGSIRSHRLPGACALKLCGRDHVKGVCGIHSRDTHGVMGRNQACCARQNGNYTISSRLL